MFLREVSCLPYRKSISSDLRGEGIGGEIVDCSFWRGEVALLVSTDTIDSNQVSCSCIPLICKFITLVEALKVIANKLKVLSWNFNLDPYNNDDTKRHHLDDIAGSRGVICRIMICLEQQGIVHPELANITHLLSLNFSTNCCFGTLPLELRKLANLD
ncbi:uncharacterized protein LOC131069612 [Cryptomeria japonica]|uniref:uncharacterized protein LOC131069612 n=1 Tax=Cryptomeria japonica TaxID=3369 RepID=UPI0027DA3D39|nr:uncharacterized protein LOC131069612 [Cryptomeria japonica]